jgi:hypothetical protein
MGIQAGDKVKIADIGPLATCIGRKDDQVKLELDGERFWISTNLCDAILNEME